MKCHRDHRDQVLTDMTEQLIQWEKPPSSRVLAMCGTQSYLLKPFESVTRNQMCCSLIQDSDGDIKPNWKCILGFREEGFGRTQVVP